MKRATLIGLAILAGFVAWLVMASFWYSFIGMVPFHWWFYWAWPLPEDFWMDGLVLLVSGIMGCLPFGLVARFVWDRRKARGQKVYGESNFAGPKQMKAGGITSRRSL